MRHTCGMHRRVMLKDPETSERWGIRCDGLDTVITTGDAGSPGEQRETHESLELARQYAERAELQQLRRGLKLHDPKPEPCRPHVLLGLRGTYTGTLPMASLEGVLLCTDDTVNYTELLAVNPLGGTRSLARISPTSRISELAYAAGAPVFAIVDHAVSVLHTKDAALYEIVPPSGLPASIIQRVGTLAVWFDQGHVVVRDFSTDEDIVRIPAEPVMYGGHTAQLAVALSPDGNRLALCVKPGEIAIITVATGEVERTIYGRFEMIRHLFFADGGRWLIAKEEYGACALLCIDVETGRRREGWPNFGNLGVAHIALDASGTRIAIAGPFDLMRIFDLRTFTLRHVFRVDHVSKRFTAEWTADDRVATRTDLGVVGIYSVPK